MGGIIRIQKEMVRLLNKWSSGYETALMEELVVFVNKLSPYEIVEKPGEVVWILRNKKTLKVVDEIT